MPARNRVLDTALLAVALVGPLLHLMGILTRGTALLNADYSRLTLIYVALGLSAAAGVWVVLRNRGPWRTLAIVAVVANLASIAYAAQRWSVDLQRSLVEADLSPTQAGKVGVLVAAAGYAESDIAAARDLEKALGDALQRVDLGTVASVRRIPPVSGEEQAQRQCRQMGAHVIVWQSRDAEGVAIYHVTVLGANETPITLEPLTLMLLMATQDTFTVSRTFTEVGKEVPVLTRAVVPVAAGMVSLAVGQPVQAAAQFLATQQLNGLPLQALRAAHDYRGIALLLAQRPDLAIGEYEAAQALGADARSWVGMGNVLVAQREWRAAARAYQQAITLDAYHPAAYCGLGITYASEHNVTKALVAYNQAIALRPSWAVPYALLGRAYELVADVAAAKQAYDTCAALAGPQAGLYVAAVERATGVVQNPPTPVPTATPLPTVTPAPTPILPVYAVQRGDTLASIAEKLGVTMEAIIKINDLENPDSLSIGQQLIIPEEE